MQGLFVVAGIVLEDDDAVFVDEDDERNTGAFEGVEELVFLVVVIRPCEIVALEIGEGAVWLVVFVDRKDCETGAAICVREFRERGHRYQAGTAPGGPEIDEDGMAAKGAERSRFAVGVGELDIRSRMRREWRVRSDGGRLHVADRVGCHAVDELYSIGWGEEKDAVG